MRVISILNRRSTSCSSALAHNHWVQSNEELLGINNLFRRSLMIGDVPIPREEHVLM